MIEVLDHVGKPSAAAACLGLEGRGVGVGRVVVEAHQRHQSGRPERGGRSKALRLPAFSVLSYQRQTPTEHFRRGKVAPVVIEAVDADLEAVAPKVIDEATLDV